MNIQSIKDKILSDLRIQYPESVIHEVKSFKKDFHGFYNVGAVMEKDVLDSDNEPLKLKYHTGVLPFPRHKFDDLSEDDKKRWRDKNDFEVRPLGKLSGQLFYLDFVYKGS